MSAEPNHAEEQLRRYAEQRRQHVPGELHPATRNMLLGEVARTYGKSGEKARGFRWGWVQALAWLIMAVAIPVFLMPRSPSTKPEEARPALNSAPDDAELPESKAPTAAEVILSDRDAAAQRPQLPMASAPGGAAGARRELPRSAKDLEKEVLAQKAAPQRLMKLDEARADAAPTLASSAQNAPSPMAAAAVSQPALLDNDDLSFANNVQSAALNTFRFRQLGRSVQVIESDGSKYIGRVTTQQAGADVFRAEGVSRTLNQQLVITGQVSRAQSQGTPAQISNTRNYNNFSNNNRATSNSLNSDDVRVQGQAVYGNNQIKIDAQLAPSK